MHLRIKPNWYKTTNGSTEAIRTYILRSNFFLSVKRGLSKYFYITENLAISRSFVSILLFYFIFFILFFISSVPLYK